jgi:hypothetical protein
MEPATIVFLFGGGALLLFVIVYFFFDRRHSATGKTDCQESKPSGLGHPKPFSITFARLFGLITVAVLAAGLGLAGGDSEFIAPAFTLLGTVAGYLAGAKATIPPDGPTDAHL